MIHAIRIPVGILAILAGIASLGGGGLEGIPGAVIGGALGVLCLRPYLVELAANLFMAPFRAMLGKDSLTLRKEYSEVHAALARHDAEDAYDQVQAILAETPNEREAQLLRVRICYEELGRIEDALKHAFAALESLEWDDTQGRILMLAVDMMMDSGRQMDAANLLAQGGQRLMNRVQRNNALSKLGNLKV
jgi:hypothetical protein